MNTISRIFFITSIVIGAFLVSSCATLTQDIVVETHVNPDIDFNTYRSYAWIGSAQIVFDPIGQWEQPTLDTDEEVKFNINRELRSKGLFEVRSDPDLLVAFAAGVDMTFLKLKEDPESKQEVLTNVPKAALVIALIDADTGYTVWLGFAEGDAQEQQTIENIRTRIDFAVSEIFKSFKQ
ncbi:MAG: DUF4136 domain-containing protein [Gammaproteobacteria bacterium]|nr:DUF4136 domain-containing protein [Gammaproteobacteria bacterium]